MIEQDLLAFERQMAPQKVALFERQFGEHYLLLAYHAALPLVLTPELVHYLRTEFLLDWVPSWEAEADLLLSDLCSQVGYELYVMNTAVRAYLMDQMDRDDRIPKDRKQSIAQVLISYVSYLSGLNLGLRERELQVQRWAAMAYLGDEDCRQMADEIAQQFEMSGGQGSSVAVKAEFARLAQITEELEGQLQAFPQLVGFAKRVGQTFRSPQSLSAAERRQVFVVGDRRLRLPDELLPGELRSEGLETGSYRVGELQTFEFEYGEFVESELSAVEANPVRSLRPFEHRFQVATIEVRTGEAESRQPWQFWKRSAASEPKVIIRRTVKQDLQYLETLAKGVSLELVKIPGGQFLMGAPEDELESFSWERPQHEVMISEFYMGKYAVTQAQWRFVAGLPQVARELDPDPSRFKGNDRPVEQVSWWDAREFCDRLSRHTGRVYRLPSEAEWEYACRAGTTTPFHFGETIDAEVANYCAQDEKINDKIYSGKYGQGRLGEYRKQTVPVGLLKVANEFGLYDMHGNVWEWCEDHWHDNYSEAPVDGVAWIDPDASEDAKRVLRGGSWFLDPRFCRSASRYYDDAGIRDNVIGFRVVCFAPRT
jgi:formylglycine-generating enzyme required for sulfatase activity